MPRLAPDGFVVSLQNGVNEPLIASLVGAERTVGAFVNFGADYLGPGRIFLGGRGALYVGELDGSRTERLERLLRDLPDAKATANILGFLWGKEAYGAMLFATAVSDLSIADALAEPRYRARLLAARARGARRRARADRAVRRLRRRRPRRLDRPARRVQPPLGEDALRHLPRPDGAQAARRRRRCSPTSTGRCSRRTLELIEEIEDGRRTCEVANLELLAAYERLQERAPALNA